MRADVVVLIPVFNDWDCVSLLLPLLDRALARVSAAPRVLLVDDGSTRPVPSDFGQQSYEHLGSIEILHLSRNLGHQRAIAIGLYHVHLHMRCAKVLIMDADGQDLPDQAADLLEAAAQTPGQVVFAARTKRLETLAFRAGYHLYRFLHKVFTGVSVRVGNFSVLPWEALTRLVVVSDLWSHYAAAVIRARIPYRDVPMPRGDRLAGNSRMNFAALLVHGLSAICVFSDIVSARVLATAAALTTLTAAGAAAAWGAHFVAGWQVPAWIIVLLAGMAFVDVQALLLGVVLAFTIIANRSQMSFIPVRDGRYFVRSQTLVYTRTVSPVVVTTGRG
jgi:polyisoprenyl-phosphate glycosyltransferase